MVDFYEVDACPQFVWWSLRGRVVARVPIYLKGVYVYVCEREREKERKVCK